MLGLRCFYMILLFLLPLAACRKTTSVLPPEVPDWERLTTDKVVLELPKTVPLLTGADITLTKELLYDRYTLQDVYDYGDTVRSFKWDIVKKCLAFIENMQDIHPHWGVFRNYKNLQGEAPLVEPYRRNAYRLATDTFGIERYQSVPLYAGTDTLMPVRYGRDGAIVQLVDERGSFFVVQPVTRPCQRPCAVRLSMP